MAITVVGSVAFDSIETPAGRRERCLGGAATYFSLAASYFTDVRVIAVVGEDFGGRQEAVFQARKIDTRGIEHAAGKSFFWEGSYLENLNEAKTHNTESECLRGLRAEDSRGLRRLRVSVSGQYRSGLAAARARGDAGVKLVAGDTMNYWIKDHRPALLEVLKGLDILLINDTEARMLAGNNNLVQAARAVLALGPKTLVVKHGEYGATLFRTRSEAKDKTFRAPALPLEEVVDPTGAGDSFAGGFFGYLASQPEQTPAAYRRAMFYGSVMGSFACERFGTERLQQLTREEIDERFKLFRELTHLD